MQPAALATLRHHALQPSPLPPGRDARASFLYGLAQLPLALRLVARTPDLRRRVVVPVLVVTAVCLAAAAGAAERGGLASGATSFFVTLVGIASMPPVLFAGSFTRLAAVVRNHLGLGPRDPAPRPLRALIREAIAQAILLALGVVPLVLLARVLPGVGDLVVLLLGGLWTLHWIVVEALDSARTRPQGQAAPEPDDPGAPWYVRMYRFPASRPLGPLEAFSRFVGRLGRRWDREVAVVESEPWLAAGLAVGAAALLAIPGLNLLFRPVVVVAAAHVLGRLDEAPPALHPGS